MVWRRLLTIVLPLCLLCSLASAQTSSTEITATLPTWTATDSQLQLLDQEVTHTGFKIQPPLGYTDIPLSPDSNMTTSKVNRQGAGWKGPLHENGAAPRFFVQSAVLVKMPLKPIVPHDLVKKESVKSLHDLKGVVTSGVEDGVLNGIASARVYWKGTLTDSRFPGMTGPVAHGFIYVTWNPQTKTVNWVEGEDTDPYYAQTCKELEAAALTLKPN